MPNADGHALAPFDFAPYAKAWKIEAALLQPLQQPFVGIFDGVEHEVIARLLEQAEIEDFEANTNPIVFEEGASSENCPLYIILTGRFTVLHRRSGRQPKTIAFDDPPVLLADVEIMVQNVETKDLKRGRKNCFLSTVQCLGTGRVLKIPNARTIIWEQASFRLVSNIGRAIAIKLLRRNADTDASPAEKVVRYLRDLQPDLIKTKTGYELPRPITYKEVAEAIGHSLNTVDHAASNKLKSWGLTWSCDSRENWTFHMTEGFYRQLKSQRWHLIATTWGPGRQEGKATGQKAVGQKKAP